MNCLRQDNRCPSPMHCNERGKCSGFRMSDLSRGQKFGLMFNAEQREQKRKITALEKRLTNLKAERDALTEKLELERQRFDSLLGVKE